MRTTVIVYSDTENFAREITVEAVNGGEDVQLVDVRITPRPGVLGLRPMDVPWFAQALDLLQRAGVGGALPPALTSSNGDGVDDASTVGAPAEEETTTEGVPTGEEISEAADVSPVKAPGISISAKRLAEYQRAYLKAKGDTEKVAAIVGVSKGSATSVVSKLRRENLLPRRH